MSGIKQSALTTLSLSILFVLLASTPLAQTETPTSEVPSEFARAQRAPSKPIPLGWKITIVATGFAVAASALLFSVRAWRSSNLFDREYRFPPVKSAALRLGANKSGGSMATVDFSDRAGPISDSSSENL
jgi:hypothetical protein